MKSFLIAVGLCATLMACASSSDEPKEKQEYINNDSPSGGGGGGGWYNPCGRTYVLEFPLPDGGVVRKEVPVYCNPYADEYYGDPPDYRTSPEDMRINPPQYQPNEQMNNAR